MTEGAQQERLEKMRRLLATQDLEALFVTKPENRRYLSGFTGSAGVLLITARNAVLLTDGRYEAQARQEALQWQVVIYKNSVFEVLPEICAEFRVHEIGFEQDHLTYQQFAKLQEHLPLISLRPVTGFIEKLRVIKDATEISLIQEAAVVTGAAFWYLLGVLNYGQSEQEIAGTMEFFMRRHGGGLPAFETIVAAGERGSFPHGVASQQQVRCGQMVVIDLGARYQGYAADLTRTICLGRVDPRQREVYEVVREAQARALAHLRPGVQAGEVDAAARGFLATLGYGEFFPHSLGHGVGLSVHEDPRLAPRQETVLEPGMVITVEPGVYLPGWGGVRIEDTVLVTQNGCEILTPVTKDLLVI